MSGPLFCALCITWPFFTKIRKITCDCWLLKVTSNLPFTRKRKLSKCSIAYYSNATATRRILLLAGDIELNPGWENGQMICDSTHVSNSKQTECFPSAVNLCMPVRISERSYLHCHPFHNAINCIHGNNAV